MGCGENEPGCTGFAEEQTVERVGLDVKCKIVVKVTFLTCP